MDELKVCQLVPIGEGIINIDSSPRLMTETEIEELRKFWQPMIDKGYYKLNVRKPRKKDWEELL